MRRALIALFAIVLTCASAWAQVGGVQVAPVSITFEGSQRIAALTLRNGRAAAVAFEIDVYQWTQVAGEDVLTPSADLIVAPGVFEIAADRAQVIRLGVRGAQSDAERTYRLIIRELPRRTQAPGAGLGFALEMSLPVFVAPERAAASLQARVEQRGEAAVLILANAGAAHAQIQTVETEAGRISGAPRYMLAGARAELAVPAGAQTVRLRAFSDAPIDQVIDVRRPARVSEP